MDMEANAIRELGILLLDDENGINKDAYDKLHTMLMESGSEDILNAVDSCDGRFFIGEQFAEEQLKILNED
jgi:hypothetical protein